MTYGAGSKPAYSARTDGASRSVTVPETTSTSACRRSPSAAPVVLSSSSRRIDAATTSMAQQASPRLKTDIDSCGPQSSVKRIGSPVAGMSSARPGEHELGEGEQGASTWAVGQLAHDGARLLGVPG